MGDEAREGDWHQTDDLHTPKGKGDPFAAAIRATRMSMIITDPNLPDNPIVFANDAFLKLTGYSRDEVIGRNCRFLQGGKTDRHEVERLRKAVQEKEDIAIDILNYRKDGTTFWNALFMSPVVDESGELRYFFASQIDITKHKRIEREISAQNADFEAAVRTRTEQLEQALESKNTLIHEVDHRVKNNLQIVSSLVLMQSRNVKDDAARETLRSILNRIDALGTVHKLLYQSSDLPQLNVAALVRDLVTNLMASSGRDGISVDLDLDDIEIVAEKASPIALIINELVTNALKHAFGSDGKGTITIAVKNHDQQVKVEVSDDGKGMDGERPLASFGTKLVESLARQLRTRIEWAPVELGTSVKMLIPASEIN